MKKILAVYNTCGISGRENLEDYISSIELILDQDFDSFDLIVSSCLNEKATIDSLLDKFSGKIFVNFVKECHPVNVTFNHAVRRYIDKFGPCGSYLYVDSGTSFPQKTLFKDLNSYLETGKYGMITPQPENDTEYYNGLGVGRHDKDDEYAREILFKEGDYIIPIGKGMGTHTNLISEDLRSFYGNVYPDIFASHCTESTFSFLNAALKKNWILLKDYILPHKISLDGQSSGFSPGLWQVTGRPTYDHPYIIDSILERLVTEESKACGFGYEECRGIMRHDSSQYDENYHSTNEDLKEFLKNKLFLKKEELDYEEIEHEFFY